MSRNVPPVQDDNYHKGMAWAGTRPYFTPEQRKEYVDTDGFRRPWVDVSPLLSTLCAKFQRCCEEGFTD
jgi:hypothetical protein